MVWVKLDDHFDEHPKIAQVDNDALALWVCGLAYCNRNLTDGFIPKQVALGQLRFCEKSTVEAIKQLVDAGLWAQERGGFRIHDYLTYQKSRETVLAERESGKKRAADSYAHKKANSSAEENAKNSRIFGDSSVILQPLPNPDSRFPDSRSPGVPNPEPSTGESCAAARKKRGQADANAAESGSTEPSPCRQTWEAYSGAYERKYGVAPIRNAKVNGQISQLVARLGKDSAPKVAAWFLEHRGAWYVRDRHTIGLLLRDCEKLHTEWATNNPLHERDVQEVDRLSADHAMWKRISQDMKERKNGLG